MPLKEVDNISMAGKKNTSEKGLPIRKRSFSGLERLNKEYQTIVRPILGKRGFVRVEIIESWSDIVGESLSVGIHPEKLKFEKGARTNGTLYVKSAGGAFALLCEHNKKKILDRINTFFGYPAVANIRILQGKLQLNVVDKTEVSIEISEEERKQIREKAALIEDEQLRETLYQTGIAFLTRKKKKSLNFS